MPPVYRMPPASSTAAIAQLSASTSPTELRRQAKKQLKQALKDLQGQYRTEVDKARLDLENRLEQQLKSLKEAASPASRKKAEAARKEKVKAARRQAEYDVYKLIMVQAALNDSPLEVCHKRAQAFAEHIVTWSPAGHSDVGYVG